MVAAGIVLALLAVIAGSCRGLGPATSPETLIRQLFTALTDRDGDRVRDLASCSSSPLCTAAALHEGYQPPEQLQIRAASTTTGTDGNEHRDIPVHYAIAGAAYDETIGVTRYRQGILGHEWRITEPPGATVDLRSAHRDHLHLAGIDVPANPPNDNTGVDRRLPWAPPGRYSVTAAGDQLYEPTQTTITVAGDSDRVSVTISPVIRPNLLAEVERQIRDRIDHCAEQPDLRPDTDPSPVATDTCPFRHDSPYAITDVPMWRVDRYPTITLDVHEDAVITIRTVTPGSATVAYRWTTDIVEPRRWTSTSSTTDFTIDGHVTLNDGVVTWTP
jgi:hypothetical protein